MELNRSVSNAATEGPATGRDGTRRRLLEAAGPVFADKGLRGATVREICERAGVNVASIHYHFGDKEKLYIEVVRHARRQREEAYPFPDESGVSPERWLSGFVNTLLRRLLEPGAPWQVRLLMREVLEPTAACSALVEDYFRPDFERLVRVVRELAGPGQPGAAYQAIAISIVGQCVFYRVGEHVLRRLLPADVWEDDDHEHLVARLAQHISRFSLAAIHGLHADREGDQYDA